MPLLEQERYRIKDLADVWGVSEGLVEDYLETGKLTASVVLTQSNNYLNWYKIGEMPQKQNLYFDDELPTYYEYCNEDDIDTEALFMIEETDADSFRMRTNSILYHINRYDFLEWNSKSECDLKDCLVRLTCDDTPDWFYIFEKSKIINKSQIRITRKSIDKFLNDCCDNDDTPPAGLSPLTAVLRVSPKTTDELKIALMVDNAFYGENGLFDPDSRHRHKTQIEQIIKKICKDNGYTLSNEAINRITVMVNRDKNGGASRTPSPKLK